MIGQELTPHLFEYSPGQQPVTGPTGRCLSKIRSRPDELIQFGGNDPTGRCIIQTQTSQCSWRYRYAKTILGRCVRDRANSNDVLGRLYDHHRARPVLSSVDVARQFFVGPQIGVLDNLARSKGHSVGQSIHLMIEFRSLGRGLCAFDQADRLLIELAGENHPAIAGFQSGVLM